MSQTIKEKEVNVTYRCFIGYSLTEPMSHFSIFGKNYVHRFDDSDIFEMIFKKILEEAKHPHHTLEVQKAYKKRKETVERVFTDAKGRHFSPKIKIHITLIFACMNLKIAGFLSALKINPSKF